VDSQGVCNICRAFEKRVGRFDAHNGLRRLNAIFEQTKKTAKDYHCLVPLSGGKDSCAVLDMIARRYPWARLLAVTLDNGLLAPKAMQNAIRITQQLRVDHIVWRPERSLEVMRIFLLKTGHSCAPCEVSMLQMTNTLSRRHGIPLVAMGNSSRLDPAHPAKANPWLPPFFNAVIRDEKDADELRHGICEPDLLYNLGARVLTRKIRYVTLPDFVDWNPNKNQETLSKRYGLKFHGSHFDCLGSPVADWLYKRRCGFGQKTAGLAAKVRNGLIPREQALKQLETMDEFGKEFPLKQGREFLKRLNLSADQVIQASKLRPDPYLGLFFQVLTLARRIMGMTIA